MKLASMALLLALSCGAPPAALDSGPGTAPDAGPEEAAAVLACRAAEQLQIGRCARLDGAPCDGSEPTAETAFAALPPDGALPAIVGPQGSTMFTLAVRAPDIAPGDPARVFAEDNPVLEVELVDEGAARVISSYRGRAGFRASPDVSGLFDNAQIFVVVDQPSSALRSRRFTVRALLRDVAGELRCGSGTLLVSD